MTTYLDLPGINGANASCPDAPALDIIGDFELRSLVAPTLWMPPDTSYIVSKGGTTTLGGYRQSIIATGRLVMGCNDGATSAAHGAVTTPPGVNGQPLWLRQTWDADNGADQHVVTWEWSPANDGVNWTTFAAPLSVTPAFAPAAGTQVLAVGTHSLGGMPFTGRILRVLVLDGIGGPVVASPDFTQLAPGQRQFADRQGNPWTVNGAAAIRGFAAAGVLV